MTPFRRLFAVALLAIAANPACAADPIFPPGARVGMVPLVGLVRAKTFIGFETEDKGVKVVVADLPAEAYGEVANAFKANPGGTGGIKPQSIETPAGLGYYTVEDARNAQSGNVRRYSMILPGLAFSGYIAVQVPENASKIYTDDAVRQAMASGRRLAIGFEDRYRVYGEKCFRRHFSVAGNRSRCWTGMSVTRVLLRVCGCGVC